MVGVATRLCLAHYNLFDLSILAEIIPSAKRLEELAFVAYGGVETNHIDQVLLHDPHTSQVLPTRGLDLALFRFLLLRSGSLSML